MDIIFDVLKAIEEKGGSIKPTHLLYKSNLSHGRMKSYLDELYEKDLIEERTVKKNKAIALTDEGFKFLAKYKQMREFTETFGL